MHAQIVELHKVLDGIMKSEESAALAREDKLMLLVEDAKASYQVL